MRHIPRPYQKYTSEQVVSAYDAGLRRVLCTLATGLGKTLCIADVVEKFLGRGFNCLIVVHRKEIVESIHREIYNYCGFTAEFGNQMSGIEMAETRAPLTARVVVASVQTLTSANRRAGVLARLSVKPIVIITDECHHSVAAQGYVSLYDEIGIGVENGVNYHVGFTATDYRTDEKQLFALDENDKPTQVWHDKKAQIRRDTRPDECPYEKRLVNFDIKWGQREGWLCDIRLQPVYTPTSLKGLKKDKDGEFLPSEIQKRVNNGKRTNLVINNWRKVCPDAQTMAFCAGVVHAHDSSKLLNDYKENLAVALDGTTDKHIRESELNKFLAYRRQFITNYNLFTEGTNLPNCACIWILRPSNSALVITQAVGRGLRPLPGVIDHLHDAPAAERRAAIAASKKPYLIVFDPVDKFSDTVYRVQQIVGIPANVKIDGVAFLDVADKITEFCERTGRDIGECPLSYEEMDIIIGHHEALKTNTRIRNKEAWQPTERGYTFTKTRPGYTAELQCTEEGKRLVVRHGSTEIMSKREKPEAAASDLSAFLNVAAKHVTNAIDAHATANPRDRNTTSRLTEKQVNFLLKHCHPRVTREEIDTWPYKRATGTIQMIFRKWDKAKETAQ